MLAQVRRANVRERHPQQQHARAPIEPVPLPCGAAHPRGPPRHPVAHGVSPHLDTDRHTLAARAAVREYLLEPRMYDLAPPLLRLLAGGGRGMGRRRGVSLINTIAQECPPTHLHAVDASDEICDLAPRRALNSARYRDAEAGVLRCVTRIRYLYLYLRAKGQSALPRPSAHTHRTAALRTSSGVQ